MSVLTDINTEHSRKSFIVEHLLILIKLSIKQKQFFEIQKNISEPKKKKNLKLRKKITESRKKLKSSLGSIFLDSEIFFSTLNFFWRF